MRRVIIHIDINQFFVAVARLEDPSLIGKPVVVAGDNRRGIVSTASYEARKYGISSAMPTYMAKKLCPQLIIRPVTFDLYQKKSRELFDFLRQNYTSQIEIVSIDECYMDITDLIKNEVSPLNYLKTLQQRILSSTKLGVSIGVGPTKFLAKMGSDYKKPLGITIIRKRDIKRILYPLDVKDFYGIGKKTIPRLNDIGIKTIKDLANNSSYELKKILGTFYVTMKKWLNGEGDDVVDPTPSDPKSISSTSTFLYDTNDYEEITNQLKERAQEVAYQAQYDKKVGKTITLIIKEASFKSISRSITINKPINSFLDIYSNVMKLFDKYFNNQYIRLAGVGLSTLIDKKDFFVQISLFDQQQNQKECRTKLLVNRLNQKANKKIFNVASALNEDSK